MDRALMFKRGCNENGELADRHFGEMTVSYIGSGTKKG